MFNEFFFQIEDYLVYCRTKGLATKTIKSYEPGRLVLYLWPCGYNDYKRQNAIHTIGATFVVRAKKNVKYKRVSWKRKLQSNVLSNSVIHFTGHNQQESYPETLRLIRYWDEENQREFIFLTNNFDLSGGLRSSHPITNKKKFAVSGEFSQ